jgi:hypothetical protein
MVILLPVDVNDTASLAPKVTFKLLADIAPLVVTANDVLGLAARNNSPPLPVIYSFDANTFTAALPKFNVNALALSLTLIVLLGLTTNVGALVVK